MQQQSLSWSDGNNSIGGLNRRFASKKSMKSVHIFKVLRSGKAVKK
jgi:hypothetical protein